MGIRLYLKGWDLAYRVPDARRIDWVSQPVAVPRYGKPVSGSESWCVLYDAPEGGNELARFKASEVTGYTYNKD